MVCTENAKIISPDELRETIENEECHNPTVDRLMFIETRAKEGVPGKIFPCYVWAWREVIDTNKDVKRYEFQADIIQYRSGEFGIIQVVLHAEELGVNKRIWDKPPTKGLREENPFLEEEVQ